MVTSDQKSMSQIIMTPDQKAGRFLVMEAEMREFEGLKKKFEGICILLSYSVCKTCLTCIELVKISIRVSGNRRRISKNRGE